MNGSGNIGMGAYVSDFNSISIFVFFSVDVCMCARVCDCIPEFQSPIFLSFKLSHTYA